MRRASGPRLGTSCNMRAFLSRPDPDWAFGISSLGWFADPVPRSKNINKGELALKHAVGLGAQPSVIPVSTPVVDGPPRPVEVGWHPVGGLAGKWFAEETGLGKIITDKINKYPDPTQHWAVLVGDYAHQLWMVSLRGGARASESLAPFC